MTCNTRTRVMLVDDHQVMRDLLRDALENTGEYQVVAQAADGAEALRVAPSAAPDVIVMDVIMPVMDGIEACREITERLPETRVLMLTASNEQDAIVRSIAAGGHRVFAEVLPERSNCSLPCGRWPKGSSVSRERGQGLSRAMRSGSSESAPEPLNALTEREREILKLYAQGLTYQEIGEVRGTSGLTVRNAMSGIQRKLGFKTRQQMVVWAVRIGLVDGGQR